jgi:hypothetical protein
MNELKFVKKNQLPDLQDHLFKVIEKLSDESLEGEKLTQEIKRNLAIIEAAKVAVANGALMARCADNLYGIPISEEVPLIPRAVEDTFILNKKRDRLTPLLNYKKEA